MLGVTAKKVVNEEDAAAHDEVIDALWETDGARVVVCFCEGLTIRRLLEAAARKGHRDHFLFLGRYAMERLVCCGRRGNLRGEKGG